MDQDPISLSLILTLSPSSYLSLSLLLSPPLILSLSRRYYHPQARETAKSRLATPALAEELWAVSERLVADYV